VAQENRDPERAGEIDRDIQARVEERALRVVAAELERCDPHHLEPVERGESEHERRRDEAAQRHLPHAAAGVHDGTR
jgi:hypothetical protein